VRIDPAGFPFIALAAVPAVIVALWGSLWAVAGLLLLPLSIALFFRDPDRTSPPDARLIVAPADGRVMHAGEARPDEAPPGAWRQVTIFLSLLDVHINRSPAAGTVTRIDFMPGTFRAAFRHDSHRNERSEIWIDVDGTAVVTRQVVGLLARRVVCRLAVGKTVPLGGRIGLMKFGSRMDVFVPLTATLTVATGEHVRAGETVIARLGGGG
jgi:phosphatidylserine decarboxylase